MGSDMSWSLTRARAPFDLIAQHVVHAHTRHAHARTLQKHVAAFVARCLNHRLCMERAPMLTSRHAAR
eukprot:4993514-Alexandrium_andersonii.AAC.1